MNIAENITELVGRTPLVKLNKIGGEGEILLKLEYFNPLGSVKDRIGKSMIEGAEKKGLLSEKSTLIEPTSGNTGVALAFICAQRGYRLILTMPESMSMERRKLLIHLGAELVLTPAEKGMPGAIEKAKELAATIPDSLILQQFMNPNNPEAHRKTTGPEIWNDTEGLFDIFVAGVGTGGTVTGNGEFFKEKNKDIEIFAVEPIGSPVISGGKPGPHKIQGIGAGFIPDVLNVDILDGVIQVSAEEAGAMARRLAKEEGILTGISGGANVRAAEIVLARPENRGKRIVTVACDTGERYLSTWLFED
ncbi:MAG: cysteine synthase A [Spirochaetales bacterium]|nr:cysteine synthase A [Spirochaetales bacterium]